MQNFRSAGPRSGNRRPGGFRSRSNDSSSYFRPSSNRNRNSGGRSSWRNRGESIDVSKFVNKAVANVETEIYESKNAFADFNLAPEIKTNLAKKNYIAPTPIQDQAINHILEGKDLIGLANTGTGKTAAFLLPLIDKVFHNKYEKVLIIAPTRELVQQIDAEFKQFSYFMRLFSAVCVGGLPIFRQINDLRRNPQFVIGTPGRLKDLNERGVLKFDSFHTIVLDEVDRMLDMGFVEDITAILNQLPEKRQSLFFSATMPAKIRDLARLVLTDPITVEVKSGDTAQNVDQDIVRVRDNSTKQGQLEELLSKPELKKVLIFIETKHEVKKLTESLIHKGFKAESIHGNKNQHQRQKALNQFRDDAITILVATDVAARGLDIKDITHVINYTVPQTYNDYIHRIGRTGRANNKGYALTFVEGR